MSTELLIMIGMSMTIGIILLAVTSSYFNDRRDEKNIDVSKEIIVSIENELFSASKVIPGYQRDFSIPQNINNENYSITISGNDIILTYNEIDFLGTVPNVTGQIHKGQNTVKNVEGRVCLNLESC